jgi:acetylserotonin N-methyltransferase
MRKASPHYSADYLHLGPDGRHKRLLSALRGRSQVGITAPDGRPRAGASGFPADDWARGSIPPERARFVARTMHAHSLAAAARLAQEGQLSSVRRLLDVGGGSGCFSIALSLRNPQMRCTVLELPEMCTIAREYIAAAGVSTRVDVVAANMFLDAWPTEHDGVLFANVLHDWSRQTSVWLLSRAFTTLPPGGHVFIHEMLLDDNGDGPLDAASFSLAMFPTTQGQQFAIADVFSMLAAAGFETPRRHTTDEHFSLVSARRP